MFFLKKDVASIPFPFQMLSEPRQTRAYISANKSSYKMS